MSDVCQLAHRDPEVYLVVIPDERYRSGATNCFIVRDGDEALVVDVGGMSENGARLMRDALREVGARPEATSFFLTHLHLDHSGLLPAVAPEGDRRIFAEADDVLFAPRGEELFAAAPELVPLQLFAYYVALENGCDIDKPRNLAKSVTVE